MFDNVDVKKLLHGDAEEEEEIEQEEAEPESLIGKAEAVLDVLDPYGSPGPEREPEGEETPIQRQQRLIDRRANLERRRAKAELLAEALQDFFMACEKEPHEEAGE